MVRTLDLRSYPPVCRRWYRIMLPHLFSCVALKDPRHIVATSTSDPITFLKKTFATAIPTRDVRLCNVEVDLYELVRLAQTWFTSYWTASFSRGCIPFYGYWMAETQGSSWAQYLCRRVAWERRKVLTLFSDTEELIVKNTPTHSSNTGSRSETDSVVLY